MNSQSGLTTLCMIRLEDQVYGIDMLAIREANQFTQTVKVPGAPPEVLGLVMWKRPTSSPISHAGIAQRPSSANSSCCKAFSRSRHTRRASRLRLS